MNVNNKKKWKASNHALWKSSAFQYPPVTPCLHLQDRGAA